MAELPHQLSPLPAPSLHHHHHHHPAIICNPYHPQAPSSLHALRDHCASRLPSYRLRDVILPLPLPGNLGLDETFMSNPNPPVEQEQNSAAKPRPTSTTATRTKEHARTYSEVIRSPADLPTVQAVRPHSYPNPTETTLAVPQGPPATSGIVASKNKARKLPAAFHSRNGLIEEWNKPPPAMITRKSYSATSPNSISSASTTLSSTTDWVSAQQSANNSPSTTSHTSPSVTEITPSPARPLIPPIRKFKSSRRSVEMEKDDNTLRALEGFGRINSKRASHSEQDEQTSDDSDLFLKAAKEEGLAQQASNRDVNNPSRLDSRRSRMGQRQSLPPNHPSLSSRRLSEQDNSSRMGDDQEAMAYNSSARDRAPTALNDTRNRYHGPMLRSTPSSPRVMASREMSPDSPSLNSGRRPSIPDTNLPSRGPYRQSNLSYTSRTYNSSPLVSHTMDINDAAEIIRAAEGTESTVSTTAPSTVWDELEELKSRIHRLELTGKRPATSGGAVSRTSNERPATATTTVTTLSSSPKRPRGNSLSPTESAGPISPSSDVHPLLQSALANSKMLLDADVFGALHATASDALAIAEMMGLSGQPGPLSGSQSTVGGPAVSDRQVRRKTESICRNLTELCLALSESKRDEVKPTSNQTTSRPESRDTEAQNNAGLTNGQRQAAGNEIARAKSSPRALSRLEARRSSLLATSSLPSPRYNLESGTPTQASLNGRRTSLFLRGRRAGTEELEGEDESQSRPPSRANTEIGQMGRFRNTPREQAPQQSVHNSRLPQVQSGLPVRRHYISTSLGDSAPASSPPVSLGNRRFFDRTTPERDTSSVVGRLAEDRGQRKSTIGQGLSLGRTGSLTRRPRPLSSSDPSNAN